MESHIIHLTPAALKHGNLNLSQCGKDFFPVDVFGNSSRSKGIGTPITLEIEGLGKPIKTDIPTDKSTGRPRWIFREKKMAKMPIRYMAICFQESFINARVKQ